MVASVGVITAGRGYDYLTKEVASAKHDYYTGSGEAPGQWAGRAAALLGSSGEVDADEMAVLYGRFVVPATVGGTRLPSGRWEREQVLGQAVRLQQELAGEHTAIVRILARLDSDSRRAAAVGAAVPLLSRPRIGASEFVALLPTSVQRSSSAPGMSTGVRTPTRAQPPYR